MEYITIALAKGRLAKKVLGLMKIAGISGGGNSSNDRQLIITDEKKGIRYFYVKATDVPVYVDYGIADLGVVGKDTLLEEERNLYELLDLGFGKCYMAVAGPKDKESNLERCKRVATKYPNIAKAYFYEKKNQKIEIIKLNGSMELAPLVGLSDIIVDIVETGNTLRANDLDVYEEICQISARLVANPISYKIKGKQIDDIVDKLEEALKEGQDDD